MHLPRSAEIYINHDTLGKLRFLADCCGAQCVDEYAEQILVEHCASMYPNLDAVMDKANRARKEVLKEAKDQLKMQQQPTQPGVA